MVLQYVSFWTIVIGFGELGHSLGQSENLGTFRGPRNAFYWPYSYGPTITPITGYFCEYWSEPQDNLNIQVIKKVCDQIPHL